jgi:hypothetical protein
MGNRGSKDIRDGMSRYHSWWPGIFVNEEEYSERPGTESCPGWIASLLGTEHILGSQVSTVGSRP